MSGIIQKNDIVKDIEKTFSTSNSPDELFDSFRVAINQKIEDLDLYKILLWNKALSNDEIAMYAEKICREIPQFSLDIYMAVAKILDSASSFRNKEKAFEYIKKAAASDKLSLKPYVFISEIYNKELDLPPFDRIANFIEEGLLNVEEKSKLNFILARMYAKIGNVEKGKIYQKRGEEYKMNGQ
jgi:hypothetical protein